MHVGEILNKLMDKVVYITQ